MLTFNELEIKTSIEGALKLRHIINLFVDSIEFKNICFLGIGGTLASAYQVVDHVKEMSSIEIFHQSAAEYITTGNKRINKDTLVVFSSVSGTTKEIIEAVEIAKQNQATIYGFVDDSSKILAHMCDYCVSYPGNEQLKFYMLVDYIMYKNNEFDDYHNYYQQLNQYLPTSLAHVGVLAKDFAVDFVNKHHKDELHYFVGAGQLWGATYSYAMCYWEEQHWMKTKSIHASEFFHGMFEVVEKDTNITLFIGEDSQRSLALRVKDFLPKICDRYTFIDTANYPLEGIDHKYRRYLSHLILRQVCHQIDIELERINNHDTNIRRYYRKLEY